MNRSYQQAARPLMTGMHCTGIALAFLLLALTVIPAAAGPTGPTGFGSGLGCAAQCIRTAVTTSHGKSVGLHITTDTPAKLKAQISTQAPIPNGNAPPYFTNPTTRSDNSFRTDWPTSFSDLEPDTTYHIVVRATDASGTTAYQQGTFRTLKREVTVTFTKILVIGDADDGVNKGEIAFDFFVNDQAVGGLGQKKIASGDTIHFSIYAHVDDAPGWLPVRVRGRECDALGWNCPLESGEPFPTNGGGSYEDWDYAHASAFVNVDDADANALPPNYGTDLPAGHDGYLIFETTGYHLKFRVYGYFDVDYVV